MLENLLIDKLKIHRNRRKCFIFDLDGTIIFDNKPLSLENEILLKQIIDAGHEIIFATGRPLREFKVVMPHWCHRLPLVLFSGGASILKEEIIRSCQIQRYLVKDIVNLCLDNKYHFIVDNLSHYYHPDYEEMNLGIIDNQAREFRISHPEQILSTEIYKILIFNMEGHEFFTDYASKNDLVIKHHSYDKCYDLVPAECNKYLGVLPFIKDFANEDIFVFGNDYNDFEILSNFNNSVLFGGIEELKKITKLNIAYDGNLQDNFFKLIKSILD